VYCSALHCVAVYKAHSDYRQSLLREQVRVAVRYIVLQCVAGSVRGVFRSLPVASMSADVLQCVAVSAAGRRSIQIGCFLIRDLGMQTAAYEFAMCDVTLHN